MRVPLGFWARSFIGFRSLFLIIVLIIAATTLVGFPLAVNCFFALRNSLTYKGSYIGVGTLMSSTLLAVAELVLIVAVGAFIERL